jgi:dipeptidyl aminopeptidase/acylaminoacyl peptidase
MKPIAAATCRICVLLAVAPALALSADTRPPVPPADYGQWETLAPMGPRGGLSPDGRWLAVGVNRSNRNNELRIFNVADGTAKVAAFGSQPAFSADSRFVAYAVGLSEAQEEKLKKDKKPVHRKLGLLNLASGETTVVDGIESFAFDASGAHLAMRRYPPEKAEKKDDAAGGSDPEPPAGATLVVRRLADGRDTSFGNVAEYAWQHKGRLLALTIATDDKTGNGVQVFDPETGALRALDSSRETYAGLVWRKDKDDLAVLRSKTAEGRDGPTHVGLAWRDLASATPNAHVYDPTADAGFPAGMRTVAFRRPAWSEEGGVLFLGIARWSESAASAKKAPAATGDNGDGAAAPSEDEDEPANVDVWHSRDVDVMAKQKVQAKADRERNLLAAWHLEGGRLVPLGKELTEQVTPIKRQPLALAANWTPHAMERSIGRPAADLALVDLLTGARIGLKERVDDRHAQASPGGRYLLFLQDDHYWTIDLESRAIVNITRNVPTSFIDRESDFTVKQKPPFGVAGWLKDDAAVILHDKLDLWRVAPDGSRAVRLTDGAAEQVRHRYVRLDPDEEAIDPEKPIHVSLFGIWTKRSGYARLRPGETTPERLVWLDKGVGRLAKAKDAEVFAYTVQGFDDSPDVFVGGPDLKQAKQVTRTNPFQERYAWGGSELVEYRSERGQRLQGALFYPAGYEPGRRYPMVVYLYEKRSDLLHQYSAPSERDSYNAAVFTSLGYLFFQPDIVFRPRDPGLSVVECVGPAVKRVVQMGLADPERVGVVGHSWGGFDASFLATHTDIFAAAVAGAPITNLVSNYGNHHWSSGIAETDHIETGQQRMEVPLWEDLPAYIRNSAVFNAHAMKTPLLIEFGDGDGTVFWHQGVELYNIARRARKQVVLLNYPGEDHGLRKKSNQIDYHRRIVQWFGHYLKGEPASPWITSGTSHLDRQQELKQLKSKAKKRVETE